MGDETAEREDRLAYCHASLLPIWERWTGGNPALRRLLECRSADPDSHEERLRLLVRTTGELRRHGGDSPGAAAALLVASACFRAYVGTAEEAWREAVERALAADRSASPLPEGNMAPG